MCSVTLKVCKLLATTWYITDIWKSSLKTMFIPRMLKNPIKNRRLEGAIKFIGKNFKWRHKNENCTLIKGILNIKTYLCLKYTLALLHDLYVNPLSNKYVSTLLLLWFEWLVWQEHVFQNILFNKVFPAEAHWFAYRGGKLGKKSAEKISLGEIKIKSCGNVKVVCTRA